MSSPIFAVGDELFAELLNSIKTNFTVQKFTATGASTWTKPAGLSRALVEVQGCGGSGGGAAAASGGNGAVGGGGGGGGYALKLFTAAELATTETVTLGTPGAAATAGANNGNAGTATTFATGKAYVVTANGGGAGTGGAATGTYVVRAGGSGGTATGGDVNITGEDGWPGFGAGGNPAPYNRGGKSRWGMGASSSTTDGTGNTALLYGSGSAGGIVYAGVGAARASLVAATALVVVYNFL